MVGLRWAIRVCRIVGLRRMVGGRWMVGLWLRIGLRLMVGNWAAHPSDLLCPTNPIRSYVVAAYAFPGRPSSRPTHSLAASRSGWRMTHFGCLSDRSLGNWADPRDILSLATGAMGIWSGISMRLAVAFSRLTGQVRWCRHRRSRSCGGHQVGGQRMSNCEGTRQEDSRHGPPP